MGTFGSVINITKDINPVTFSFDLFRRKIYEFIPQDVPGLNFLQEYITCRRQPVQGECGHDTVEEEAVRIRPEMGFENVKGNDFRQVVINADRLMAPLLQHADKL